MHASDEKAEIHSVTMVTERTRKASEAIFALLDEDQVNGLRLHQADISLCVIDKNGVEIGRFPSGHPLSKPQTRQMTITGFELIGNADDPTSPNLIINVRIASDSDDDRDPS